MMHDFLTSHREELVARCQKKVADRAAPNTRDEKLAFGIGFFLDQLIETLAVEQAPDPAMRSRQISGPSGGELSYLSEMGDTATKHGRELMLHGFTVDSVVHDYGDLCQAITELATDRSARFNTDEFHTLNRCLDNAIADAVTEFAGQRDLVVANKHSDALNLRLGAFAHEVRNLLNSATLALTAIKEGNVGLKGATGAVLDRSLVGLRNLIDRSLSEVRMTAGMPAQNQRFSLAEFIEEMKLSASLEANLEECVLTVRHVDPRLAVDADRDLLFSAVGNLLQNAFKFTRPNTEVILHAYAVEDRVRIDVEDHCGGLPEGEAEYMFLPFTQSGLNKTGLGLGLPISRRGVEVNDGTLDVHNKPGSGCIFRIDLPRHAVVELVAPGLELRV
ncbi:MAG: HAMP domain-containing histidine kinase [Verrucomicrobiota bacterium]|nr:HAMP domain-containing histidine kinase [Verrucomicrobiota bacterium]